MIRVVVNEKHRFGRLTVIREASPGKNYARYFLCSCDCGNKSNIYLGHLRGGKIKSCGCLKRERLVEQHNKNKKHGMTRSRFYNIWLCMKQRCLNPKQPAYMHYGGRGITLCNEWKGFMNFKEDMYKSYINHVELFGEKNTSIDRRNNEKGYRKENCRWATAKQQRNNSRQKTNNREF